MSHNVLAHLLLLAIMCQTIEAVDWKASGSEQLKKFRMSSKFSFAERLVNKLVTSDREPEKDYPYLEDRGLDPDLPFEPKCWISRHKDFKFPVNLLFFSHKDHDPFRDSPAEPIQLVIGKDEEDQEIDEIRQKLLGPRKLYDPSLMTYFIIHGFLSDWRPDSWQTRLKDFVLNRTQANVFIVDWSGGANPLLPIDYGAAVANTRITAQHVARFISNLIGESGAENADDFIILGHSLGGHISGFIGYALGDDLKLGTIIALDPAGPCFRTSVSARDPRVSLTGYLEPELAPNGRRRLSAESAKLVIAIHTDTSRFGLSENVGHFDVYPNGGTHQPGCRDPLMRARNKLRGHSEFKLDDAEAFCEHSYGRNLVASFASHLGAFFRNILPKSRDDRSANGQDRPRATRKRAAVKPEQKCYPMAFECSNWNQFKAGECGICLDDDPSCVYIGLTRDKEKQLNMQTLLKYRQLKRPDQCPFYLPPDFIPEERIRHHNADLTFNDEGNPSTNLKVWRPITPLEDPDYLITSARHFIRTSARRPYCLFQYQIVVAVDQDRQVRKSRFFLKLPLESDEIRYRLIQVSHQLDLESRAHYKMSNQFVNYLSSAYDSESLKRLEALGSSLVYYTALITFEVEPNCIDIGPEEERTLCKPVPSVRSAKLFAEEAEVLAGVRWVAINYMNGLRMVERLAGSEILLAKVGSLSKNFHIEEALERPELKPLTFVDKISACLGHGKTIKRHGVAMNSLRYNLNLVQLPKDSSTSPRSSDSNNLV